MKKTYFLFLYFIFTLQLCNGQLNFQVINPKGSDGLQEIVYGQNQFLLVGFPSNIIPFIFVTSDPTTTTSWEPVEIDFIDNSIISALYVEELDQFYIFGNNHVYISNNTRDWETYEITISPNSAYGLGSDIIYFNNGEEGLFVSSSLYFFLLATTISKDGIHWTNTFPPNFGHYQLDRILSINNEIILEGESSDALNIVAYSKDGSNWRIQNFTDIYQQIGNGEGQALSIGASDTELYGTFVFVEDSRNVFIASEDGGITWKLRSEIDFLPSGIGYANGNIFLMTTYNSYTQMSSDGGYTWITINDFVNLSLVNPFQCPVYLNELYYVIDTEGQLLWSNNGVNWTFVDEGILNQIVTLSLLENVYIATTFDKTYSSIDGINFQVQLYYPFNFEAVLDNTFYGIYMNPMLSYYNNFLYSTNDGINWKVLNISFIPNIPNPIAYNGDGIWALVGIDDDYNINVYVSTNPMEENSWNMVSQFLVPSVLYSFVGGNGIFGLFFRTSNELYLYVSPTCEKGTWKLINITEIDIQGLYFTGSLFLGYSYEENFIISKDLETFTSTNLQENSGLPAYGNGVYYSIDYRNNGILSSKDGISWNSNEITPSITFLNLISANNDHLAVVSYNQIWVAEI